MPYSGPGDDSLPERIKKLSQEKRNHWVGAFNGAFKQSGEEGKAFAVANAAIAEAVYSGTLEEQESITARLQGVHDAVRQRYPDSPSGPYTDPQEIFDEFVVLRRGGKLLRLDYSIDEGGAVVLATDETLVKAQYVGINEGSPAEDPSALTGINEQENQSELSEDSGKVAVTIIRPGWSANGRYYSKEVLAAAIPLFEGSLAYVNHPTSTELKERPGRDVLDLAGYFQGVHLGENGEIRATLTLVGKKAEAVKSIIEEAAKNKPDLIGISINGAGKTRQGIAEGRKGLIVESIVLIHSSDIVTSAAAGGTFDRLVAQMDYVTAIIAETSFEQWRAAHPDWQPQEGNVDNNDQAAVIKEQVDAALKEALAPVQERLRETEGALATAKQRESARQKLEASVLPKVIYQDLMEELAVLEPEQQDKRIEAEVEKLKKLNIQPVVVGGGAGDSKSEDFAEQEGKLLTKAGILGDAPMVHPGESYNDWFKRTRSQTA